MHNNRSVLSRQRRVRHHAAAHDAFRFFDLLTSPELFDTLEATLPAHRERLFPPTETLSMFMAQAMKSDRSCQGIVDDVAVKRLLHGLPLCSTKTGAYCKARRRLPLEMVSEMAITTGHLIAGKAAHSWRWRGRPVRLVDGTTVTLPDTPANQATYPQQSGQKPGLGFPICRIVGITCLASGALLNAVMGKFKGKGGSEQTLLRSLLDTLETGDLLLGDAFYASYFLLAELGLRGVDAVFEQHGARKRSTDFRRGKRLGSRDHSITLTKPKIRPDWMTIEQYESAPDTLSVRELEVGGKVVVTTLLCPKTTPKIALKALYKRRWHVELDIRNIKTTLGMETLSCKTPQMGEKEMWVYLLAYNLIRMIMLQSALLADVLPRALSFKHTLQLWLAASEALHHLDDNDKVAEFLALVAEQTVANRPGRIEPRAIKRRPKSYPLLTETRPVARATVQKYGHPKKVK
ncbi:IS4 family transposase [Collimonas antrihumi]|uniref:IS4 family transposase n=1 Tax=Collimonas antrihumi TaxID=1940615 RepID=UPI001B8D99AF|nr:IS4 family transposase [Collimonas antrihumi]